MAKNRIQLEPDDYRVVEAVGDGAVNPGNIVEFTSTGKLRKHSEEGGRGMIMVAVEDALQGDTVDDAYADGDRVVAHIQSPGNLFQGLLLANEDVHIGEGLVSDGAGRLKAEGSVGSSSVEKVLAYAMEASAPDADTLIAVRSA